MKIGKVAKICIYPTLIRFPPISAPFIKYIVVPFKDATIIISRPEIISKGDLEELFPWPPGFYESVTRKTEHTVPEVNHHHYHWLNLSLLEPFSSLILFTQLSLFSPLLNSSIVYAMLSPNLGFLNGNYFQFRALLKAAGFDAIIVEKRETEKMETKSKVNFLWRKLTFSFYSTFAKKYISLKLPFPGVWTVQI